MSPAQMRGLENSNARHEVEFKMIGEGLHKFWSGCAEDFGNQLIGIRGLYRPRENLY
jgi:hypothetical protein